MAESNPIRRVPSTTVVTRWLIAFDFAVPFRRFRTCYAISGPNVGYAASRFALFTDLKLARNGSDFTLRFQAPGTVRYLPTRTLCNAHIDLGAPIAMKFSTVPNGFASGSPLVQQGTRFTNSGLALTTLGFRVWGLGLTVQVYECLCECVRQGAEMGVWCALSSHACSYAIPAITFCQSTVKPSTLDPRP
eukprot:3940550-Rhodomonas_salina.4